MRRTKTGDLEYRDLSEALTHTNPACNNDWRFTLDADDLDDDEKTQMHNICRRCPLLDTCRIYAVTARPGGGFWAGRYWGRKERT